MTGLTQLGAVGISVVHVNRMGRRPDCSGLLRIEQERIMRAQGWHAANSLRFLVIFFALGLPQSMRAQVKAAKPAVTTPAQATQQNLNPGDDRVIIKRI